MVQAHVFVGEKEQALPADANHGVCGFVSYKIQKM